MLAYYNKQCILKLEEISVAHFILFYFLLDALMIYYISIFLGSKCQRIKTLVVVQHDSLVFDELNFQNSVFFSKWCLWLDLLGVGLCGSLLHKFKHWEF